MSEGLHINYSEVIRIPTSLLFPVPCMVEKKLYSQHKATLRKLIKKPCYFPSWTCSLLSGPRVPQEVGSSVILGIAVAEQPGL